MTQKTNENRCIAYATATTYRIKEVTREFRASHRVTPFREVCFVSIREDENGETYGAFIFPYGTVVMWGLTHEEETYVLSTLKPYEEGSYDAPEKEAMPYTYGNRGSITSDRIIVPQGYLNVKLAFSHGLAQSAKLSVFEGIIKKTISTTRTIPEQLAKFGRITLSRKEIRCKMGELFIERSSINLHFDILDTPDYFWEHADLEPLYTLIANHLDLETRVEVLNQRLDVIHDLFEMLGTELNHQHSNRLEWIIILLIVSEVIISLLREFT